MNYPFQTLHGANWAFLLFPYSINIYRAPMCQALGVFTPLPFIIVPCPVFFDYFFSPCVCVCTLKRTDNMSNLQSPRYHNYGSLWSPCLKRTAHIPLRRRAYDDVENQDTRGHREKCCFLQHSCAYSCIYLFNKHLLSITDTSGWVCNSRV